MRPAIDAFTATFCVAPAFRVLLAGLKFSQPEPGLTLSQFAPSSVWDVAVQEPEEPQLVSVTIWAAGLARPDPVVQSAIAVETG